MKFKMMIGGVETIFPESEVQYDKETNEVIIFFLKLKKEEFIRIEQNIKKANLKIAKNYLLLNLKDFQCAYDLNKNKEIMNLYINGCGIGFAFKDEDDNLLNIATPTFYKLNFIQKIKHMLTNLLK